MQQISVNKKHGQCVLRVENLEDLWYLQQLVEPGDLIKGKTTRKIKLEGGSDRTANVVKKIIHLEITAEKIQLTDVALRVSGPAKHGTEDITAGQYHTFNLEPGSEFTLEKPHWLSFHWDKLEEACMPTHAPILIVIHDRENAIFATMKKTGVEIVSQLSGQVAKKRMEQQTGNFFRDVAKQIEQYMERMNPESVILASPSFFKEYVHKELKGDMTNKLIMATVSSVSQNALKELLHRSEVKAALAKDRHSQEQQKVEHLFSLIAKDGNACYGLHESELAANSGAVDEILVTDTVLRKMHEEGTYSTLDAVFKAVDRADGKITIISGAHEGGMRLDGLGGVAALLRFRVS